MNRYEITYTSSDMKDDFICRSVKYARDEKEAVKYLGTKPDKSGVFRLKRGGIGTIKAIKQL